MAQRARATFGKRQKERARQEKQQEKQQRKLQRKLEKRESPEGTEGDEFGSNLEVATDAESLSDATIAAPRQPQLKGNPNEEAIRGQSVL